MQGNKCHAEPTLAIVMPALNEEATVGRQTLMLRRHPAICALPLTRIIVVDNGSSDGTAAAARAAGATVVSEPRRGYGAACLAGVYAAADADIVLLMDADGSDDPEGAARVAAAALRGEADLVMGSRTRGSCEPGALTPQQRVGNAVGALALRVFYGLRVSDIGPVRAIRRDTLLRLDMREMAYGWSTEMLAKAARAGLSIREIPVDYFRRAGGNSKVAGTFSGTLKASFHILRTLSRYVRWNPERAPETMHGDFSQRVNTPASNVTNVDTSAAASAANTDTSLTPTSTHKKSALFIMARLPVEGQTKTRLAASVGHAAATHLYATFLRDLGERFTQASTRDGYDLYWYYAAPDEASDETFAAYLPNGSRLLRQSAGDFNERLWRGFQALAALGYERVVVISSDSPHLPAAWVRAAFTKLEDHAVVIGPACDGGYYLLGQRIQSAPHDLFTGIAMSTPQVYAQTVARAHAAGLSLGLAPETFDVDEVGDLAPLHAVLTAAPSDEADRAPATLATLDTLRHTAASTAHVPALLSREAAPLTEGAAHDAP